MTLSAVIIARDEEDVIEGAIASCAFADEILVVDGGSSDRTVHRAMLAGARIVERPFDDFARQRTYSLSQAQGEWVLFVDADERVTPELRAEIAALLDAEPAHDGYTVPRRAMALGEWLDWHFGGADAPLRLFRRDRARIRPTPVHEVVEIPGGTTGALTQPLLHLTHRSVGDLVDKINRYAELEAAAAVERGAPEPSKRKILASFPRAFWRLWRSGLRRHGTVGAIEAVMLAFNRTLVEMKIWERHRDLASRYLRADAELAARISGDEQREVAP